MTHGQEDSRWETLGKLWELSTLLSEEMQLGLTALGLTRARGELLMEVYSAGEPRTLRVLADALNVTPRNVTELVDALERDGYLQRRPHETDRRATLVELTDNGSTAMQHMLSDAGDMAGELLGDLADDELDTFNHSLDRVLPRCRDLVARAREHAKGGP